MRLTGTFLAGLTASVAFSSLALPAVTQAATVNGADYAVQYDYREFYAATDNKRFEVVLLGNPFPEMNIDEVAKRLLPVLQANKPQPRLTFTYDVPTEPQHPDYRLMLVFNPANDLGADPVCQGVKRFKPAVPGKLYVFGVYCRNDMAMSQATARADTVSPEDPAMGSAMKELMEVVFNSSPVLRQPRGSRRR